MVDADGEEIKDEEEGFVPTYEMKNPDHPAKEVVPNPHSQKELKEKAQRDWWFDNAKSDTPAHVPLNYWDKPGWDKE